MTLYARQQKRHRCIEQTFGLWGIGRGWDDLGEWHWNMYTIKKKEFQMHFNHWRTFMKFILPLFMTCWISFYDNTSEFIFVPKLPQKILMCNLVWESWARVIDSWLAFLTTGRSPCSLFSTTKYLISKITHDANPCFKVFNECLSLKNKVQDLSHGTDLLL